MLVQQHSNVNIRLYRLKKTSVDQKRTVSESGHKCTFRFVFSRLQTDDSTEDPTTDCHVYEALVFFPEGCFFATLFESLSLISRSVPGSRHG